MQIAKLQALERQEMLFQQEKATNWVKYMYLLLEYTMGRSSYEGVLFYNLDEYAQTIALRRYANELRDECGLPPYDVVYDDLDAQIIVRNISATQLGKQFQLDVLSTQQIAELLQKNFGKMLKNLPVCTLECQLVDQISRHTSSFTLRARA